MSYETERQLIETEFQTQWAGRTPVQYGDIAIDAPDGDDWVRITILNGQGTQGSVGSPGSNLVRHTGVVAIQVHCPLGSGQARFTPFAQAVEDIFRNKTIENLRFGIPYVSGGAIQNGAFTSRTMMCPFTRDELNG